MFNSSNTNESDGYDSITFSDNGKGKVKGLGKLMERRRNSSLVARVSPSLKWIATIVESLVM